jgi:hypothetical protein
VEEREEVERRLRVLEAALGFILAGEFGAVPREQALAADRAADHLRRASAGDLMSLVDWLRHKMPYFEHQRAVLRAFS